MGLYQLDNLFHPAPIAVIGAGNKGESIGFAVMNKLTDGCGNGLFPVNPQPR